MEQIDMLLSILFMYSIVIAIFLAIAHIISVESIYSEYDLLPDDPTEYIRLVKGVS